MKILFGIMLTFFCSYCCAQITVSGNIQVKSFRSQQQEQQATYRGSGYWVKGPAVNDRICIDIIDDIGQKVSDTIIYTNAEGKFNIIVNAKKKFTLIFHYYCQNSSDALASLKIGSESTIKFNHLFKLSR